MLTSLLLTAAMVAAPGHPIQPAVATRDAVRTALDDATIVAIFDEANTADIETGRLGATKGTTKAIRDYGAMLVKAHSAVRQQGRDLAKKLGVTPTPPKDDPAPAQHAAVMKHLKSLSGLAFDRAFLEHERDYHKAVIGAIKNTLEPAIQNAELKALVVKVTPVFVQHMGAAEALLAKLPKQ